MTKGEYVDWYIEYYGHHPPTVLVERYYYGKKYGMTNKEAMKRLHELLDFTNNWLRDAKCVGYFEVVEDCQKDIEALNIAIKVLERCQDEQI